MVFGPRTSMRGRAHAHPVPDLECHPERTPEPWTLYVWSFGFLALCGSSMAFVSLSRLCRPTWSLSAPGVLQGPWVDGLNPIPCPSFYLDSFVPQTHPMSVRGHILFLNTGPGHPKPCPGIGKDLAELSHGPHALRPPSSWSYVTCRCAALKARRGLQQVLEWILSRAVPSGFQGLLTHPIDLSTHPYSPDPPNLSTSPGSPKAQSNAAGSHIALPPLQDHSVLLSYFPGFMPTEGPPGKRPHNTWQKNPPNMEFLGHEPGAAKMIQDQRKDI